MIYWIIAIVIILFVIGIIYAVFSWLIETIRDIVEKVGWVGICAFLALIIAYFTYSWKGVAITAGVEAGFVLLVSLLSETRKTVLEHDKNKKEIAKINNATQKNREKHNNEAALLKELETNCRWLGYMDDEKWKQKLPNYIQKSYETDFFQIVRNFARQMEEQNITNNNDWFMPYMQYIAEKGISGTVTKLINEVNCPQLRITHSTPDETLLESKLKESCEKASEDTPALLEEQSTQIGIIYRLTPYAERMYGKELENHEEIACSEEISMDDLDDL